MLRLIHGDCLEEMKRMPSEAYHAVVTDPPYALGKPPDMVALLTAWLNGDGFDSGAGFMGKKWDSVVGPEYWREVYRVLKPGAYLLAFCATRTWDLLSLSIRLAGFVSRDTIADFGGPPGLAWLQGQGFPKSMAVDKAIERQRKDEIQHITKFVADARDRAGLTNSDIDTHFGFNGMAGHWTSQKSQPSVPTWEQWLELKTLLNFGDTMDTEVKRLNERKGQLGDNWDKRPIIAHSKEGARNSEEDIIRLNASPAGAEFDITAPATPEAAQWEGWGTALKPAWEVILVFRKPFQGTVAENVLENSCGALNIDSCRVPVLPRLIGTKNEHATPGQHGIYGTFSDHQSQIKFDEEQRRQPKGRWPANVCLIHAPNCKRKIKWCECDE